MSSDMPKDPAQVHAHIGEEVQKEGWLGLLLHWGDPPPVVVPLTKKEIALQNLNRETLGHMEQEVLYVFTA